MESTSDALVLRLRAGDLSAVAEYVQSHRLELLAYIHRRLGPALRARIEPEDVLQETSLEALRRIADLADPERAPFGWLCQIAEHRLIDAHRKHFGAQKRSADREVGLDAPGDNTQRSPLVNLLVASLTTPSQAFSRQEKELRMAAALDSLPAEGREALRLRYQEGLPTREIAERLGKSDGAIRVLLTRTLARLEAACRQPGEDYSQSV